MNTNRESGRIAGLALAGVLALTTLGFVLYLVFRSRPLEVKIGKSSQTSEISDSDPQRMRLYFDTSGSMANFLNLKISNSASLYWEFVSQAENILTTAWPQRELKVYEFGGSVTELKDARRFAYRNPELCNQHSTRIDRAIEDAAAHRDELSVIVTDLFQEKGDINAVSSALLKPYLSDEQHAAGLIGGRSFFDGQLTEVESLDKFMGRPLRIKKGKLPFYVLILGRSPAVEKAMQQFAERIFNKYPSESKYLLISQGVATRVLAARSASEKAELTAATPLAKSNGQGPSPSQSPRNIKHSSAACYQSRNTVPSLAGDKRVLQIQLLRADSDCLVAVKLPVFVRKRTKLEWDKVYANVTAWPLMRPSGGKERSGGKKVETGDSTAGREASRGVSSSDARALCGDNNGGLCGEVGDAETADDWLQLPHGCVEDPGDHLKITCGFTAKPPTGPGPYIYRVDVHASRNAFTEDFSDWSFIFNDVAGWKKTGQAGFEGEEGKTLNLRLLVTGLLDAAYLSNPPLLARFYLVVKSK